MAENDKTRKSLSDERDRLMERRGGDDRDFMPELVLDTNSAAKEREELRKTTPVNRSHSAYRSGQGCACSHALRAYSGLAPAFCS